jgi:hypothetical protein
MMIRGSGSPFNTKNVETDALVVIAVVAIVGKYTFR